MKTGAAYLRVSTEEQTEYSLDSQLQLIKEYAEKNDILIDEEHIYCDDGISGRTAEKRPEFLRMIGTAKNKPKPFDVILIWKYSRFARNMEESILYKGLLKKLGITLISISEPLPDGEFASLMERVIEWMDQYYSIRLGGEVRRGMTEAASRGKPVTIAPIGYKFEKGELKGKLIVDEERAEVVRKIFNEYCAGKGTREIAKELNKLGVKTNRGGKWENRTVEDVLRNKTYIGYIHWNPKRKTRRHYDDPEIIETLGTYEHIISDEQFEQAQKKIAAQKELYGKYSRAQTGQPYMLHGLVRCSACGSTLTRCTSGSLQCHNYARGKCSVSHSVTIDRLNPIVIKTLESMFDGTIPPVFSKPKPITGKENTEQIITESINREKKRLERIYSSYEDGIYSKEEFAQRREKAEKAIQELEKTLKDTIAENASAAPKPEITDTHLNVLKNIKDDTIDEEKKNEVLRSIVDHIDFNRPESTISIYLKPDPVKTDS